MEPDTVIQIILAPLLWAAWLILWAVLFVAGLFTCGAALACSAYALEPGRDTYHWTWKFMWVWDNAEDGICPAIYRIENNYSVQRGIFMWATLRNNVNNMARIKYLNCALVKGELQVAQCSWANWCRQGPYAGGSIIIAGKSYGYGYGFIPWMINGYPANDTRDTPYVAQHWSVPVLGVIGLLALGAWFA
jgi:hypothetical protein